GQGEAGGGLKAERQQPHGAGSLRQGHGGLGLGHLGHDELGLMRTSLRASECAGDGELRGGGPGAIEEQIALGVLEPAVEHPAGGSVDRDRRRELPAEAGLGVDFPIIHDLRIEQAPVRVRVQDLITDTCSKLDRNLTSEEWAQHLGHIPYRNTCEHLNPAIVAAHKGRQ
ncbi:MAG: hypothetical protein ABSD56_09590, partial [Bryobacteraceae bacterium]